MTYVSSLQEYVRNYNRFVLDTQQINKHNEQSKFSKRFKCSQFKSHFSQAGQTPHNRREIPLWRCSFCPTRSLLGRPKWRRRLSAPSTTKHTHFRSVIVTILLFLLSSRRSFFPSSFLSSFPSFLPSVLFSFFLPSYLFHSFLPYSFLVMTTTMRYPSYDTVS